jgi:hypothetical protein
MKHKTGKTATIFIVIIIALAGTSAGYALWYEDLYIKADVNTGEVYGFWSACYCFDAGLDPNPDGTRKDKDVGWTTCIIDDDDPRILHITIYNGYPCYWNDCEVEYTIGGTVPVRVQSIEIIPYGFTLASDYGADDGEIWVKMVDGLGSQLHPGDESAGSFKVHVEQSAEQLTTYEFDIIIKVVQWNEYVP